MTEDEDSDLEAKLSLPSLGRGGRSRSGRKRRQSPAPERWWSREHVVAQATGAHSRSASSASAAPPPPVMREVWVAQARQEPTAVVPTPAIEPGSEPVIEPGAADLVPQPTPSDPTPAPPAAAPTPDATPSARRRFPLPSLPNLPALPSVEGRTAALVTGVIVGLTGVLLVYLSESGCSAVRGAGSCGGAGIVLLVAIFALLVLEGAALLHALGVESQTSTSLLAVGLLAVLTILVLLPVVDRWWMVLLIPVVSAATYLGSWWISTTYGAAGERS